MFCPKCNSDNVRIESVQENLGSTSITRTKYKGPKKPHGLLWKLFIGWWWWIVKLPFQLLLFPFIAIYKVFNRRGTALRSHGTTKSVNHIVYKTVCTCQNCGNTWEINTI